MQPGTKLGRYEIRSKIGEGGMGEVFLAYDKQLDRMVALKVLLPEFCSDLERVQRFQLEAKAASALNHPNIITIHEIDEFDDRLYITTEFIDGETVREKILGGELTMLESIGIAEQIADALSVAHEAHIVHRDIKPENIMIRRDGYAKILDFGLAKPMLRHSAGNEDATIQLVNTQPGIVMGSVRYMSPEQARGRETDERTDVWSLGVVLYEMLTGANPFEGETFSDSLAALIHVEPAAVDDIPEELRRILRKAIKKNSAERYQSIKDFALDLKDLRMILERDSSGVQPLHISNTSGSARRDTSENKTLIHRTLSGENQYGPSTGWVPTQVKTISKKAKMTALPLIVAALAITALAGAWIYLPSLFGRSRPVFQSIQVSAKTDNGKAELAAVSPDGKLVSFVDTSGGRPRLLLRQLANDTSIEIVPPSAIRYFQPTFSPDGQLIYYVQIDNHVGTLSRVSTLGGQSKRLVYDVDSRVAVSPDGKQIAFIRHDPEAGGDSVFTADNEGKNLEAFISTKDVGYDKFNDVVWSTDGGRLFIGGLEKSEVPGQRIKVISISLADIDRKPAEPPEFAALNKDAWYFAGNFVLLGNDDGVVFIGRKGQDDKNQIWHASFSDGVLRQVTTDTSDYHSLSVSAGGDTIIATKVDKISGLLSFNPATRETRQLLSESRTFMGVRGISQMPDGRILYSRQTGKEINIFSISADGSGERQITSDSGFNLGPLSTPDGRYIIFNSNRNNGFGIWRMDQDGANPVQLTSIENGKDSQYQVTPDGKTLIFTRLTSDGGKGTLMKMSIDGGEAEPLSLKNGDSSVMMPQISPRGNSLAYLSLDYDRETSEFDASVHIVPLADNSAGNSTGLIKVALQTRFNWAPNGKSLSYISADDNSNVWNLSIADDKRTQITDFNSGEIGYFLWSIDGRKLFLVRGIKSSDLVLIKEMDGAS